MTVASTGSNLRTIGIRTEASAESAARENQRIIRRRLFTNTGTNLMRPLLRDHKAQRRPRLLADFIAWPCSPQLCIEFDREPMIPVPTHPSHCTEALLAPADDARFLEVAITPLGPRAAINEIAKLLEPNQCFRDRFPVANYDSDTHEVALHSDRWRLHRSRGGRCSAPYHSPRSVAREIPWATSSLAWSYPFLRGNNSARIQAPRRSRQAGKSSVSSSTIQRTTSSARIGRNMLESTGT